MLPQQWRTRRARALLSAAGLAVAGFSMASRWPVLADAAQLPAQAAQPEFHPSCGDLMTIAVQARHIKLGAAGSAGNWNYAGDELNELRDAFARIARTIPRYVDADTQALFASMTSEPLVAVSSAIQRRDAAAFRLAYQRPTGAGNACHVGQGRSFVVIRTPTRNPYVDQSLGLRVP
jgi:hypothetical protein